MRVWWGNPGALWGWCVRAALRLGQEAAGMGIGNKSQVDEMRSGGACAEERDAVRYGASIVSSLDVAAFAQISRRKSQDTDP